MRGFRLRFTPLVTTGLVACALLVAADPALASVLYSVVTTTLPTDIQIVNQVTGAESPLGASGFSFLADLASDWRPDSFRLWAADAATSTLVQINPATGAGSAVGTFHLAVAGTPVPIASLAFNAVDGRLYGTSGKSYGATLGDQLYVIDPETAVATPVGAIVGHDDVFALGFGLDGTLYGVSVADETLLSINLTTGVGTPRWAMPVPQAFDIAARPEDGALFLTDSSTHTLYRVDPAAGTFTPVGPLTDSYNVVGLAFSPVPEPATTTTTAVLLSLHLRRHRRPNSLPPSDPR